MEWKELQNFKQQIKIITYNDYNSQFSDGMEIEQGMGKRIKTVDANTYVLML